MRIIPDPTPHPDPVPDPEPDPMPKPVGEPRPGGPTAAVAAARRDGDA